MVSLNIVNGQNQSRVFNFPVKPGKVEWQKLTTYEGRLNAYNIPDKLLQNMNTADLLQTCLNYPEFRLIMTRNSLQQGYDYLLTIFNGFRELEKRKDAGKELIKVYKQLNPADIISYETPVKRGGFSFQFTYIEIILAQRNIISNLDNADKQDIVKTTISNYQAKKGLTSEYATFDLTTPALILGRFLDIENNLEFVNKKSKNDKIRNFVDYSFLGETAILEEIINISKQYLK